MNGSLGTQLLESDKEIARIGKIARTVLERKAATKEEGRAAGRVAQELQRREKDDNTDRDLAELRRKVGVLEERVGMYKSRTEEGRNLALRMQIAETKLRQKGRKLEALREQIQDSTYQVLTMSESGTIARQVKLLADKNVELQKASSLLFTQVRTSTSSRGTAMC